MISDSVSGTREKRGGIAGVQMPGTLFPGGVTGVFI